MKRGKDEEKIMGPMFPRLHVNDTEKGGPRPPPRNKMALYEQLSIPSQRFNPGLLPLNPNSSSHSNPPPSSSQGGGHERGRFLLQQPTSGHPAEKMRDCYSDFGNQLVQREKNKKQDEDDFSVPIFVQSDSNGKDVGRAKEGLLPVSPSYSVLAKAQKPVEKEPKKTDTSALNLRHERTSLREEKENNHDYVAERLVKSPLNHSSRKNTKSSLKQADASSSLRSRENPANNLGKLKGNHDNIQLDCRGDWLPDNTMWGDSVRSTQEEVLRSSNDPNSCDAVSEGSMVDSISGTDISPDDVVGMIGPKHFWKARRAIVNQQRVFAVQVFELHRLIKVQRLIAASPHLLIEENAYLGKPLKVSSTKKLPLDYVVKSTPSAIKGKEECEKPNHETECTAENAVEKASNSSVQNGTQASNHRLFSGNSIPATDSKIPSWSFNQPAGHQWLIPVVSPSEGLIYKPYPGPGFMSPVCGGCGPPGSTPLMGNPFVHYGFPPYHPYQGLGVPPFAAPPSHSYFPPYSMPPPNQSLSSSANEQNSQFSFHLQGSFNLSNKNNGNFVRFRASKDSEVQVSTASSPSEGMASGGNDRNALPLFPASPVVQPSEGENSDRPANVIKVVPHNAKSATESVARIFRSIQEERKQFDSV